jgi:Cdc6-like AAA superfamily ATPase
LKSTPFIEWLEGKEKTLFCPGIPGTGKTMIASIVVDHLKASFPDDKTGKAFLYCIYKRQDNQKVDDLLASLLGQLAVWQSMVPESIRELYDKHRRGEKPRLSRNEILEASAASQRLTLGPSSLSMLWMSAKQIAFAVNCYLKYTSSRKDPTLD